MAVWDPADPSSHQMANYFTHPDQIPVSKSEKVDNAIDACVTTVDKVIAYCRAGSVYPMTFGLACCAMEMIEVGIVEVMIQASSARFDFERLGMIPRAT